LALDSVPNWLAVELERPQFFHSLAAWPNFLLEKNETRLKMGFLTSIESKTTSPKSVTE